MLTLQDTLASQCDLSRLCAERPLVTNEVFGPNAFYGMAPVLKLYAGLPQTYALKVVVPHGLHFTDSHVWELEAKARVPVVLCYPPYRERAYARHTTKQVILSASPFLYAAEMLRTQPRPERRGTIFFPVHSTHWSTAHTDYESLADQLNHLEDEYQPVTVCMYWRDVNLGLHVAFQKRGFSIVSAGHMFGDPDFLYRFFHLCSLHRYASGNSVGSHIFYSIKAGCSYFHFDNHRPSYETPPENFLMVFAGEKHDTLPETAIEGSVKALFRSPSPHMSEEQLRTADYFLGASYLKSPQELREQLLHAERLDKFGFVVRVGRSRRFVVPTYYRRLVVRLLRLPLSWLPPEVRTRTTHVVARLRKGSHRRH